MGYSPNIRYGIIGRNLLESQMSFEEATVAFVVTKPISDEEICRYARFLIDRGVRDYAFCGVDSKHWHSLFDITDVDINQDNDDYSNTWDIESVERISEAMLIAKENVYIFCSDYEVLRKCQEVITVAENRI